MLHVIRSRRVAGDLHPIRRGHLSVETVRGAVMRLLKKSLVAPFSITFNNYYYHDFSIACKLGKELLSTK